MTHPHSPQAQGTPSAWQQATQTAKGQSGLRALNERRILTLIRQQHELPKATIAKQTGLSAQAVTVIINKLENDGLLRRGAPQRGRVGQPTVPFSLNAEGAFGIGLKIGRRSMELTLIDFCGTVRATLREQWCYPSITKLNQFTEKGLRALTSTLSQANKERISGIGVAMPFELWRWSEQANAPESELAQWQNTDVPALVQSHTDLPVMLCNDASAACAAELWFGKNTQLNDYLYCFVGTFLGGGLVLDRQLHVGRKGNAGAIGSLPFTHQANHQQLLDQSSLYTLEKQLQAENIDTQFLHNSPAYWPQTHTAIEVWIEEVAQGLAHAAISAHAILDLDGVVIEGNLPAEIKKKLVLTCEAKLIEIDQRGLGTLAVFEGSIGEKAQSIGSANLPLLAQYSV